MFSTKPSLICLTGETVSITCTSGFKDVISDPEWTEVVDILTEAAMSKKLGSIEDVEIDAESYEEVQALAQELDMDLDIDIDA